MRVRLIEIGEAVKGLDSALLDTEPTVPWRAFARTRYHLAHRCFATDHALVAEVVDNELLPLATAVRALIGRAAR